MELVYLWVDKYKNIKNQGFNFSPRFECEYENNKLTICDKKKKECKDNNYIENFFGDNINVTAIVGKNGSGKSSVLNSIVNSSENIHGKYILVFTNKKNKFYYSNIELNTLLAKAEDRGNKLKLITYLDRGDNDSFPIDMGVTPLSKPEKYPWINFREISTSKESIVNLLAVEIGKNDSSFELLTFMYLPNKILIQLKTPEELISKHIRFTLKNRNEIEQYFISLSDREHQLLIIEYLRKKGSRDNTLDIIKNKNKLGSLNKDLNISNLIDEKEWNIDALTEKEKNLYIRRDGYFHLLNFDFMDKKERRYNNLSDGEKKIFGQLLNIYFYTEKNDDVVFLFDEPDISLHPDWNKKYMNEVILFLKKFEGKKHFIVTSHSPFLLSDIPKQNIIFLKNDKEGNCKVVEGITQTFGQNIHTLLSDSFFMEDGLMGEFAKGKINDVYNFIVHHKTDKIKSKEDAQAIIDIVGEPLIQRELQQLFDKKFELTNMSIDDEISLLERKLKALKEIKK